MADGLAAAVAQGQDRETVTVAETTVTLFLEIVNISVKEAMEMPRTERESVPGPL